MVAAVAYSKISGQVAKDKAHLEEINKSIKETNESMDLTNVDVRENRIKDLEAKARDAQAALDGDAWKQIWNSIFGIQSEASGILAAAALLRTPQEFQDKLAELVRIAQLQRTFRSRLVLNWVNLQVSCVLILILGSSEGVWGLS